MPERMRFDEAGLHELFTSPDGDVAKDLTRRTIRVERNAKQFCPVKTGRLRSSITHALEHDSQGLVGIIGTDVDYAPHVFLGTLKMEGRPALQAAVAMEIGR